MIAIVDYGIGNLFSLKSSFAKIGEDAVVTSDESVIRESDRIILPGVGAFEDAILKLRQSGLDKAVIEETQKGKPLMGICLGMQLLFEKSYEYGEHIGLGLIKGEIRPLFENSRTDLKVPHMGWNKLSFVGKKDKIFKYINEGDSVYFVHSFHGTDCENSLIAVSEYGETITAAVRRGNICGCQFHPEKSGNVGLSILKAFCEL
ncbi:MAG: imidazole glycerol phosphate synthase subunit HisH [Clostridia bacterium]|nr:imidazole glycerol phosphate synthase subunit HisH [Clostridia bacterium]